jgi:tetratricopeptide (TPR) repeat protein
MTPVAAFPLSAASPLECPSVLDGLGSLIDKSLVRVDERGADVRYDMFETVREFALEQLDQAGEREWVLERHARYFLELAKRAEPELEGLNQTRWARTLEREHPNLREAFATMEALGDDEGFVRLADALGSFWFMRSHTVEGLQHSERALARESATTLARARILLTAGTLAYACGDYAKAERWLQEGEELALAFGEKALLANCAMMRGSVAEHLGDEARAQFYFETGLILAREVDNDVLIGEMRTNLSDAAYRRGDLGQAEDFALDAIPSLQACGDACMESVNFGNVAQVALARGAIPDAAESFAQGLNIAEEVESRWAMTDAIAGAAAVSAALGRYEEAARLLGAADAERVRSGHPRLPHFCLFAQTQDVVHGHLAPESFQAGWDAGHGLATEKAVAEARAVLARATRSAVSSNGENAIA